MYPSFTPYLPSIDLGNDSPIDGDRPRRPCGSGGAEAAASAMIGRDLIIARDRLRNLSSTSSANIHADDNDEWPVAGPSHSSAASERVRKRVHDATDRSRTRSNRPRKRRRCCSLPPLSSSDRDIQSAQRPPTRAHYLDRGHHDRVDADLEGSFARPHRNLSGHGLGMAGTCRDLSLGQASEWRANHHASASRCSKYRTGVEATRALPGRLGNAKIYLGYVAADGTSDAPPAFYAGSNIPTIMYLDVEHRSCVPFHLRPQLELSMTGTLDLPHSKTTIVSVNVTVPDALKSWSKNALAAHSKYPPHALQGHANPKLALPGGVYSLPLQVAIPYTDLPPSLDTAGGKFQISYDLTVRLTVDHPSRPSERINLCTAKAPFILLPPTVPDRPRSINWISTFQWHRCGLKWRGKSITDCSTVKEAWTFKAKLPCTKFSPTETVPLELTLIPRHVASAQAKLFVRVGIKRRQRVSCSGQGDDSPPTDDDVENVVHTRMGIFDVSGQDPTNVSGITLPLSVDGLWTHGYSAFAGKVSFVKNGQLKANHPSDTAASNQFYVFIQVGRLPDGDVVTRDVLGDLPKNKLLRIDTERVLNLNLPIDQLAQGTVPITIGSVAEPRDAMHYHAWSDITNETNSENGSRPALIEGGSFSNENGWLVPPPSYAESINTPSGPCDELTVTTLCSSESEEKDEIQTPLPTPINTTPRYDWTFHPVSACAFFNCNHS